MALDCHVARPASPVCYLDEADDLYAGYMTRAETIRLLGGLIDQIDAQAAALLPAGGGRVDADGIGRRREGAVRRALPRIRDDGLHALLASLLPETPAP